MSNNNQEGTKAMTTTTYPTEIYTECARMADDLDIDLWEDEEDGRVIFKLDDGSRLRSLSPAHCFDELQAMGRAQKAKAAERTRNFMTPEQAFASISKNGPTRRMVRQARLIRTRQSRLVPVTEKQAAFAADVEAMRDPLARDTENHA